LKIYQAWEPLDERMDAELRDKLVGEEIENSYDDESREWTGKGGILLVSIKE
jgi:hypothetical protein